MLKNHNRPKLPTVAEPGRTNPDRSPGNNVLCSHGAVYSRRTPGRNVSGAGSRNCDLALSPPPNLIIEAPQAPVCLFCQLQATSLQSVRGPRTMPDHVAGRPSRAHRTCPSGNRTCRQPPPVVLRRHSSNCLASSRSAGLSTSIPNSG